MKIVVSPETARPSRGVGEEIIPLVECDIKKRKRALSPETANHEDI